MKSLINVLVMSFMVSLSVLSCTSPGNKLPAARSSGIATRVLLVTGGHSFNKENFFEMIFSLGNFNIDTLSQPLANRALLSDSIGVYDVIVFYDMWQDISEMEKKAFLGLTEHGTGLVFLHHSLVSYQNWEEFTEIRGGKYYERGYDYPQAQLSGYKHDITMKVEILDPQHPVTQGISDFTLVDEGYSNFRVHHGVTPLLATDHPDCGKIIGWANRYNNSKVVYLLPGHDEKAWSNENFRQILANAISWAGRKLVKFPDPIIRD
jgi:uncharacterized protein